MEITKQNWTKIMLPFEELTKTGQIKRLGRLFGEGKLSFCQYHLALLPYFTDI